MTGQKPSNRVIVPTIAYFVTPHGYGHAARSSAVMAALREQLPQIRFEIFTQVPLAFFEDSVSQPLGYHSLLTDIGLAQKNTLREDIPETLRLLSDFYPLERSFIEDLAQKVQKLGCQAVLCDIAPLGIAVAKAANLPSVLIENFTWDWIYQGYIKPTSTLAQAPALSEYVSYLQEIFTSADHHIQVQPFCQPDQPNLITNPVSRKSRTSGTAIRERLTIPTEKKIVMVTMGGGTWDYTFIDQLKYYNEAHFIIAGLGDSIQQVHNCMMLPRHSDFFHPDVVNASNVVIGKVGYSTLAEVYHAGVAFGYVPREHFPESPILQAYIEQHIPSLSLTEAQLQSQAWLDVLPKLLALPNVARQEKNGADEIAMFVLELLG